RVAGVVGDEGRTARAVPRVPGPAEVADAVAVGPVHQAIYEAVGAVVLADLGQAQRDLGRHRGERGVPAGRVRAGVEVVDVRERGKVVHRIGRLELQPLGQVVRVRQATDHDDVGGAGRPYRVDQSLEAGHLVVDAGAGATVAPAGPAGRGVAGRAL